jgi:hypothetical protein
MRAMKARRSCTGALIPVTCVALCACGGGQEHATSAAAHTARGVAHELASEGGVGGPAAAGAPSRARALAFAHAVNLGVGDIPEASVEKQHSASAGASEHREARACERRAGWGHPHTIAEVSSPKLKRGQELEIERITSSVSILSSEDAVARQFAALASPLLHKCLARVLAHNLDDKQISQARWGHVTISRLPMDAPGASATVGIRLLANLELPFSEVSMPFYEDVLAFSIGRAEVALVAASATQPVPSSTERELLSLLLARSRAHPL